MEERMKNGLLVVGMIALLLGAAACAGPSRVAMDYGTSVKLSTFNQTLNPQAGKNLEPVAGFDGGAAKYTMERYQKDFEKPPAAPGYTFRTGYTTQQ
jgi:hypothetical protein